MQDSHVHFSRRTGCVRKVSSTSADPTTRKQAMAEDAEDRLGCTMKFIRAVESQSMHSISLAIERYPHLKTLVGNPYDSALREGDGLRYARDHAVELAREHAVLELTRVRGVLPGLSEHDAKVGRARNYKLLARLSPGRGKHLSATRDQRGEIHTDPSKMADDLRSHWSPVFQAIHVHEDALPFHKPMLYRLNFF